MVQRYGGLGEDSSIGVPQVESPELFDARAPRLTITGKLGT